MAPKSKSGSIGGRVTAPVYNGAQPSAAVAISAAAAGEKAICQQSLAAQIYGRVDGLHYAVTDLVTTLERLGLYETMTAPGEAGVQAAHENVLRLISEELSRAVGRANGVLFQAVYSDTDLDEDEECAEDEGQKKPEGAIFSTSYGRNVYKECQVTILRLLSIQSMASRLNASLTGANDVAGAVREQNVTDSVHACVDNLLAHMADTTDILHRTTADILNFLLGDKGE